MTTLLETTRALTPLIESEAEASESSTTMTPAVVQALADAGLFWLMVPAELGGAEADITTTLEVFEELARADGSTGWSLMANATATCFAAIYPDDDAVKAMFPSGDLARVAGMFAPAGKGVATDDGYVVSGDYQFGSGSGHASWFSAGFMEMADGEPALTEIGLPAMRVCFVPESRVEMRGNWDVMGLAGTGSYDYRLTDLDVERAFTFALLEATPQRGGGLYRIGLMGLTAAGHAGFALGVARRALEEITAIAKAGKERLGANPIADQQLFQHDFAVHDAALRAARGYTIDSFAQAEASAVADGMVDLVQQQRMRQATTYATRVAADAARFAYTWSGSAGLRNPSVLGRCFRDLHASTQHLFVDNNSLTAYTQAVLS